MGVWAFFLMGLVFAYPSFAGFWDERAMGWHWYEPIQAPEEKPQENDEVEKKALPVPSPTDLIRAYRAELERRLHLALSVPTLENVQAYQLMQKDMSQRAQAFTDKWRESTYRNPDLDFTTLYPVNQVARHAYLDKRSAAKESKIKALSKTHGLMFFFSQSCPYCHKFAPIIKRFAKKYGFEVLAVSKDGGSLKEFPNALPDNGIAQRLNVQYLPTLLAVEPNTYEVVPLGFGLTTEDEIEERIMLLTKDAKK
ncbi:MAG: hypothetical protein C0514_08080 [Candidatus Puniceispirillum sp.]|nr:hypothetical protein [Candidatus Puniceispirillum sp.]